MGRLRQMLTQPTAEPTQPTVSLAMVVDGLIAEHDFDPGARRGHLQAVRGVAEGLGVVVPAESWVPCLTVDEARQVIETLTVVADKLDRYLDEERAQLEDERLNPRLRVADAAQLAGLATADSMEGRLAALGRMQRLMSVDTGAAYGPDGQPAMSFEAQARAEAIDRGAWPASVHWPID